MFSTPVYSEYTAVQAAENIAVALGDVDVDNTDVATATGT